MEYSLSDIQLPDPPKEKDSSESLSEKSKEKSKEINSTSKSEKNLSPKNEEELEQSNNSTKEESNGLTKKLCEPISPKTCEINQDSEKDHTDKSECSKKKDDAKEVCKSSTKEGNKHKTSEVPSAVEESTDVKDDYSKSDVSKESTEKNSEPLNDLCASKQNETEVDSKNNVNSSSSGKRNKSQHTKSRKHATVSTSKGKSSHKVDTGDSAVGKDSTKMLCKRKNRRTRHSSSQSSSSDSSSNGSSPNRASSHSKKSGKSGSSSEGIASPSSSKSSSGSDSEVNKKCLSNEKLKTGKTSPITNSEEVAKPRRKINRNLAVKSFQENDIIKEAESENTEIPSTASSNVKKDDTDNAETAKKTEVREIKFTPRKLSLSSTKSIEKSEEQDSEKSNSKLGVRKRKWGSCTATLPRTSVSISSDSLKTLIPDLKPFTVPPVLSDQDELSNPAVSIEFPLKKESKIVNLPAPEEMVHEEITTHLLIDKASSIGDAKDSPNESPACVSPPHNPTSNSLFIKNLVRPFTLFQLKELLKQTGTVVEEKFWIDKIKSKCIVTYETEEQAVTTRNVLHGTRWPLSNPKILAVDFCSEEELDVHRNMTEQPKPIKVTQQVPFERQDVKDVQAVDVSKRKNREEHKREKDRQKVPITHVREWDKDKLSQDSPEQTSHRAEKDTEKPRSDKRKEKKDSKRRVDDDAPAKLLDDLFRKTRASPCIYWLPLTEEQAKQREEERQARRMEREKRWQQRKEQEENERRNRTKGHSGREKENRRSQSRSRSPQGRRR